jgi:cytochrome c oxidase cbb3-type subunit 3
MHDSDLQPEAPSTRGSLLHHDYDGIREYDNPTPGWWHAILWATILFSAAYAAFFAGELGWTPHGRLQRAETRHLERLFGAIGTLEPDEATIVGLTVEPRWMKVGEGIFARTCAQCHRADGGGINGPNLTDDTFINVKSITDLYTTVSEGVVPKGMPAWSNRLSQNERIMVAAYVAALRGTAPGPGARGAEGEVIPPWPKAPAPSEAPATGS